MENFYSLFRKLLQNDTYPTTSSATRQAPIRKDARKKNMRGRDPQDQLLAEMLAQIISMSGQVQEVADVVARDDQEFLDDDTVKDPAPVPKADDSPPKGPGPCPVCGGPTRRRVGRKGPFYGCARYPECRGARNHDPSLFGPGPCPLCNSPTVQRVGRLGLFYGCTRYPDCQGSLDFNPDDVPTITPVKSKLDAPHRSKPRLKVSFPEAELVPELKTTVPPLPPELIDDESPDFELDDCLFDPNDDIEN